jgi:two-component system OmpR family sensor kinase
VSLSLRARLTVWYSALLCLALVLFTALVLWAEWRVLLHQTDEGLGALTVTTTNAIAEELGEQDDLAPAAAVVQQVVRAPGHLVMIFDRNGRPLNAAPESIVTGPDGVLLVKEGVHTVRAVSGARWRIAVHPAQAGQDTYVVAVAASLEGAVDQWNALLRAASIGLLFVLLLAWAGGWWLGGHGLRPLRVMAVEARDITPETADSRLSVPATADELAHVSVSFNRVLERLGNALADQRRFMADASHELRTPVSTIRTAADVTLSRPTRDPVEYREALEVVAQQSARLARLVDDMLVLARADAGGYRLVFADVDLGDLAAECVHDLAVLADPRQIALACEVARGTFVRGDQMLLRRMLLNLLHNAIVYSPVGGRVSVSLDSRDGVAELRVSDTGRGIPPEDRERIFGRFVRLDPARGEGGSGLGLAIARWIAEAHGGTLSVAQSGADGTVFAARLVNDGETIKPPSVGQSQDTEPRKRCTA